jgi:predicted secreted protein
MPSQAIAGYGTKLKMGDGGGPETFTEILEVGDIDGPSPEWDEVEVTTHSSAVAGRYKEFLTTLIDSGEVSFPINYVPSDATHIALRTVFLAGTKRNWQIVLPGNVQTISFAAYVKSGPLKFPTNEQIMQELTLRISGAITFS